MSEETDSVNDILAHLDRVKRQFENRDEPKLAVEVARWQADLRGLARENARMTKLLTPVPTGGDEDLSDLPPALLSELSKTRTDDLEEQIYAIVTAEDGVTDIDTILIGLFRKFEVIQTRRFIQNKLYRMTQKHLLHSVPGKKGTYSTLPPTETEQPDEPSFTQDFDDEIPF